MNPYQPKPASATPMPDFENNLAEFESDFLKFVSDTDPKFDFNLLRYPLTQAVTEAVIPSSTGAIYPKFKKDLNQMVTVPGPDLVNGDVFGDKVVIENNVRVQGSVYAVQDAVLGQNCVIEGSVIAGGRLEIRAGCRIDGTVVAADLTMAGKISVDGPVYSRGDLFLNGSLDTQQLIAGGNIQLNGNADDVVNVEAATIFAQNGEIEVKIPVKLGMSRRQADLDLQKFYLSVLNDGTFHLVRALNPVQAGARPAQATLITNLSDSELERLLAELAQAER